MQEGTRGTGKLTVAKIRAHTKPGMYGDGGTLFLRVAPGGSKSWIQRLSIDGKRRDIGLGGWPLTTLSEAREAAFENRRLARRGGDPLAAKRRAKVPTFREAADADLRGKQGALAQRQGGSEFAPTVEAARIPDHRRHVG